MGAVSQKPEDGCGVAETAGDYEGDGVSALQGAAGGAQRHRGHCLLQRLQPGRFPHVQPVLHRPRLLPLHVLQILPGKLFTAATPRQLLSTCSQKHTL